jgi:hypothetical protein
LIGSRYASRVQTIRTTDQKRNVMPFHTPMFSMFCEFLCGPVFAINTESDHSISLRNRSQHGITLRAHSPLNISTFASMAWLQLNQL